MPADGRAQLPDLDDRVVRTALSSMPFASVLLVDPELRYRAVIGRALNYYGYHPRNMIGQLVVDVIPPRAFAYVGPALRRALRGETFSEVREEPTLEAVFETTYAPAVDSGEVVGALAVVRDVTVEHRAVADLAAADELHQMLMSRMTDVIALLTVAEGRYTWASSSAERVLGWRPDELVGQVLFDFVHPDDEESVQNDRAALLGGAEQVSMTYRYRLGDGEWLWVEAKVRPVKDPRGVDGVLAVIRDISDRKRLEAEVARARAVFETAFVAAPIGMALISVDGRYLRVNTALCTLLGRSADELLRSDYADLTHPDDVVVSTDMIQALLTGPTSDSRLEKRYLRPDGAVVWAMVAVTLVRDDDGRPRFFITQTEDITARQTARAAIERLSTIDPLTGLPNRVLLMDRLRHALALARRSGWLVGVLVVDLDRFRGVNDAFGHDVGDELLRQVAARLENVTRPGDTMTRLGGDEFVVVCEQVGTVDEVAEVAERIRVALAVPFSALGQGVWITASVGVAVGDTDGGENLLQEADRSMYASKRRGRGRADVYAEALGTLAVEQVAAHAALAEGLERGELRAFYQPIVDLPGGAVTAQEALVRWAHPTRGVLSPAAFLDGTDRSPLGVALGEHVLQTACAAAATWNDGSAVHVNVSARHVAEPGFVAFVQHCLETSGLPPERLVLEITESLVLAASRSTLTATTALGDMGVGLCLDDFGTGYSSVTALHKLPIGGFKIDRTFIAGIHDNPTSASLVDGLISLGIGMGLDVVAEGVETREQEQWLAEHGCPHAQGFLFGRPVPTPV